MLALNCVNGVREVNSSRIAHLDRGPGLSTGGLECLRAVVREGPPQTIKKESKYWNESSTDSAPRK